MEHSDLETLLERLIPVALEAGGLIMRHYGPGTRAREKADRSPVTIADEEAERLIVAALRRLAPDIPVVAEEGMAADATPPPLGRRFFLVDPLDGTKEFLAQNGEFTVNIALIEDKRPVCGVVYLPAQGTLYAGAAPGTAFAQRQDHRRPIQARRPPPEGMLALASRSHADPRTEEILRPHRVLRTEYAGSSLKFCRIAEGSADIYPRHGRTMEWDTAAGHAVLAAAGGRVTLLDATAPLTYGKRADGFANPGFIAWGLAA
jgi:3'(2'), 5'-bisphosphate nucleotidase